MILMSRGLGVTGAGAGERVLNRGAAGDGGVALAYVGSIVADDERFESVAFSRAGQMFQENLLTSLAGAGLTPSIVLSQQPLQSFPRGRRAWSPLGHTHLRGGLRVVLVPFLNINPIRPFSVGVAVLLGLLNWGWKNRNAERRLVFTYNLTEPPGLFTLLAARMIRAKAVVAVYDINVPGETVPSTSWRRIDFLLHRWLIPRFDALIVASREIADDFGDGAPFLRIEGGVGEVVLEKAAVRCLSVSERIPFTVVFAGGLDEANGIPELLLAASLLPRGQYRIRIAGAGPLEQAVRRAAAESETVEFLGYLSFQEVLRCYDDADVLLNMRITKRLNTRYFFPSKMMEYLASGRPVITTCTGHIEDEYGKFVFLLRDETAEGLAAMIRQVAELGAEVRAQKAAAALEFISAHARWGVQGRRIVRFLETTVFGDL